MKKLNNKKGFTIVELVIVIAVIAILAAVLIPTFSSVVSQANASAAQQQAKAGLDSILALTSGSLPKGTLFSISVDDDHEPDYFFHYTNQQLKSVAESDAKAYPYEKKDGALPVYAVYVSADCFDKTTNASIHQNALDAVRPLIEATLKKTDLTDTLTVGTKSGSTYTAWTDGSVKGNAMEEVSSEKVYAEYIIYDATGQSVVEKATLRVYYTSDLQDSMVVFVGEAPATTTSAAGASD